MSWGRPEALRCLPSKRVMCQTLETQMSVWGVGHLHEHDHTGRYHRASGGPEPVDVQVQAGVRQHALLLGRRQKLQLCRRKLQLCSAGA